MVIIFSIKRVREFLLRNGFVYTLRLNRKQFGKDWMTDRRGGKWICDVWVELVDVLPRDTLGFTLTRYVKWSGYLTEGEWVNDFMRVHKLKELPEKIQLIRVVVR